MNDFTKEELELIYRMFHHFVYSPYWRKSDEEEPLKDRIQSMIDNYCEHSESQSDHNYDVERCNKCGTLFV